MSVSDVNNFRGRVSKRIKVSNEKDLNEHTFISVIAGGDKGIEEHLNKKKEQPVQEHISLLDEFQR